MLNPLVVEVEGAGSRALGAAAVGIDEKSSAS